MGIATMGLCIQTIESKATVYEKRRGKMGACRMLSRRRERPENAGEGSEPIFEVKSVDVETPKNGFLPFTDGHGSYSFLPENLEGKLPEKRSKVGKERKEIQAI